MELTDIDFASLFDESDSEAVARDVAHSNSLNMRHQSWLDAGYNEPKKLLSNLLDWIHKGRELPNSDLISLNAYLIRFKQDRAMRFGIAIRHKRTKLTDRNKALRSELGFLISLNKKLKTLSEKTLNFYGGEQNSSVLVEGLRVIVISFMHSVNKEKKISYVNVKSQARGIAHSKLILGLTRLSAIDTSTQKSKQVDTKQHKKMIRQAGLGGIIINVNPATKLKTVEKRKG